MQISRASEVSAFCRELVRCESLSGHEEAVAELVMREMAMLGYDAVVRDELGNVVGIVYGQQPGQRVLFDAHMDTVPVTSPASWRYGPYEAKWAEGRIWGRGATDVKGSLAAVVVAVGSLARATFAGTAIVAATVGEEMVEGLALGHVLARHPADCVVICEPTGLRLGIGHKGRAGVVVEAEGVAAHSSRPEMGVNAVYRMIEAVARIRRLAVQRDELLGAGVCGLVEMISSPYPGTSMVPEACTARFDRRLIRGETAESVLAEMRSALVGLRGVEVRYHRAELACYSGASFVVDDWHLAWVVPSTHEIVRQALQALTHAGQTPELYLAPFCTNGSVSAGELGLPTVIYGAGEIENAHAVDESVSVDDLLAAYRGYQALARVLAASA